MDNKEPVKIFSLCIILLSLLVLTGCPATTVSRVAPADKTPPDVTLIVTFTNPATGTIEKHQVVSPDTSGNVAVKVRVPPPPLPPEEAKGLEIGVKAIAADPQGVSHLRIMRTAAPGIRWKAEPPGPINRFSDDAQPREQLQGTLIALQQGSTIELFAEALNFGSAEAGRARTAKLIISTE